MPIRRQNHRSALLPLMREVPEMAFWAHDTSRSRLSSGLGVSKGRLNSVASCLACKVLQDYPTRFPTISAVRAQDDDLAIGVRAAQRARRNETQFVLGDAGMKEMVKRVMDDDTMIIVDVTYPPSMIASAIHLTAKSRVEGKAMPKSIIIPSVLITSNNAMDFDHPDSPF